MRGQTIRRAAALIAALAIPVAARAWTERDVATGTGFAALYGTLTLPDGEGPAPGVLILAGSGPVDRDGNLPGSAGHPCGA